MNDKVNIKNKQIYGFWAGFGAVLLLLSINSVMFWFGNSILFEKLFGSTDFSLFAFYIPLIGLLVLFIGAYKLLGFSAALLLFTIISGIFWFGSTIIFEKLLGITSFSLFILDLPLIELTVLLITPFKLLYSGSQFRPLANGIMTGTALSVVLFLLQLLVVFAIAMNEALGDNGGRW